MYVELFNIIPSHNITPCPPSCSKNLFHLHMMCKISIPVGFISANSQFIKTFLAWWCLIWPGERKSQSCVSNASAKTPLCLRSHINSLGKKHSSKYVYQYTVGHMCCTGIPGNGVPYKGLYGIISIKNKNPNFRRITRNKLTWSLVYSFLCVCEISADFGKFHPGAGKVEKNVQSKIFGQTESCQTFHPCPCRV